MMKFKKIRLIPTLLLICLFFYQSAHADVFIVIAEKEAKKKSVSWNLMDWMDTKKKFALMDQWLAFNTKSGPIFEGYIGGDIGSYNYSFLDVNNNNANTIKKQQIRSASVGLFISLLGLEGFYEHSNEPYESLSAQITARPIGPHKQSTNLSLSYGIHKQKFALGESIENQYYGGSFTLYLFRFLGGEVNYRQYLKSRARISNEQVTGRLIEYTSFIDVYFLRLLGTVYKETSDWKDPLTNQNSRKERKGLRFGAKIFF